MLLCSKSTHFSKTLRDILFGQQASLQALLSMFTGIVDAYLTSINTLLPKQPPLFTAYPVKRFLHYLSIVFFKTFCLELMLAREILHKSHISTITPNAMTFGEAFVFMFLPFEYIRYEYYL